MCGQRLFAYVLIHRMMHRLCTVSTAPSIPDSLYTSWLVTTAGPCHVLRAASLAYAQLVQGLSRMSTVDGVFRI